MHISGHPKICHLTFLSFTNENISRCQITMYNLDLGKKEKKSFLYCFKTRRQTPNIYEERSHFLEGGRVVELTCHFRGQITHAISNLPCKLYQLFWSQIGLRLHIWVFIVCIVQLSTFPQVHQQVSKWYVLNKDQKRVYGQEKQDIALWVKDYDLLTGLLWLITCFSWAGWKVRPFSQLSLTNRIRFFSCVLHDWRSG